ncbi:MAG: 3'-5' exonuclease [Proteobacteria bacterium]|nr:3'-5' exonuclease [Pseudomonadota bacterium]
MKKLVTTLLSSKRKPTHPLIIQNNQRFLAQTGFPGLLREYEFVVFDTELTGFNRKRDEIVAIGAVRIQGLRIICGQTFYALVRPDERFHTTSTLVHRLTPQELRGAVGLPEVLPRFVEFCGDAVLVGHYVGLDLDFLARATRRLMGGHLAAPHLDTIRLAMAYHELIHKEGREYAHRQGAYSLSGLTKKFGLPSFDAHNALQDSIQTAYLFLYLTRKLADLGLRTLNDFLSAGIKRTNLLS